MEVNALVHGSFSNFKHLHRHQQNPIAHSRINLLISIKMSSPQETWQKLQRMANQAGKGGGPSPKGLAGGVGALLALGGVMIVGNNALFNVDGGHRAIKYTRIGGVGKEIYSEGTNHESNIARASDNH